MMEERETKFLLVQTIEIIEIKELKGFKRCRIIETTKNLP